MSPDKTSKPSSGSGGGGGDSSKKFYHDVNNATSNNTNSNGVHLFPSSKLKLLHQRTSLSLAYDRQRGWGYRGETALYVIANNSESTGANKGGGGNTVVGNKDNNSNKAGGAGNNNNNNKNTAASSNNGYYSPLGGGDGKPIELALHMRDGCRVESVQIYGAGCSISSRNTIQRLQLQQQDGSIEDVEMTEADGNSKKRTKKSTSTNNNNKTSSGKENTMVHRLHPLPQHSVTFAHHDPLSIVMTRPANLHSVEDDGQVHFDVTTATSTTLKDASVVGSSPTKSNEGQPTKSSGSTSEFPAVRRYEADAHATRGTKGMTYSLRAASISSAVGELRIGIAPSAAATREDGRAKESSNNGGRRRAAMKDEKGDDDRILPPQSEAEAVQCWKDDLLFGSHSTTSLESTAHDMMSSHNYNTTDNTTHTTTAAGETPRGTLETKMLKEMLRHRCQSRREARIELIARSLAEASCCGALNNTDSKNGNNGSKGGEKNAKEEKKNWPLSPAMKIVVRFALQASSSSAPLFLGGINFMAPPQPHSNNETIRHDPSLSTPHVYTLTGTHGDHQGIRSWLPTLDSASPNHRCSHELVVKVTAKKEEGLWACGAGEDFGYNSSVAHPVLGSGESEEAIFGPLKERRRGTEKDGDEANGEVYERGLEEAEKVWRAVDASVGRTVGWGHKEFVNDYFYGNEDCDGGKADAIDSTNTLEDKTRTISTLDISSSSQQQLNPQMLAQLRSIRPHYITSIFSSLTWSPCPSRSLGFAIGPFCTLYDPEYFRLEDEEDDSDNEAEDEAMMMMNSEGGGGDGKLSLQETARRLGEGIRQLYFCPKYDRRWIHAHVTDEFIFGKQPQQSLHYNASIHKAVHEGQHRPQLTAAQLQDRQLLEKSILASTIGVPNRALSLMRDVLALPAYRTSSYTQIWIPHAHMSGSNSGGNFTSCQEVGGCNPFLGGAILDATLLPPPGMRLPYYDEGRSLQFVQARNAIRGWVRAALPLGADDDVGQGYLHSLIETFLLSLYERGHGAFGEGGGKGSFFYTKRYAIGSGLNSQNLDFLPLVNIEEDETGVGGGLGVAIEERGNEHLWRSASNGTETHTSSLDEYAIGQLLAKDFIEAMERTDKAVPLPSMGWQGSHQSATFLSHNSAASTSLGCGALDLVHPMGGQMYRAIKSILLNRVYEGRSGISHYTRVVRAAFIASFLRDVGVSQLKLPEEENKIGDSSGQDSKDAPPPPRPPFVVCIDEIIKKQALSHAIFTRALRVMSGPIHEPYLRGNLVDIGRENFDSKFERKLVTPEGFPNSYVRGASALYMRVGVHIEAADGGQSTSAASQSAAAVKGIHLHVVAEPVIPEGGSAFGGPVTLRVIENEGQCREFIKNIPEDGSRVEWGPVFLHARPVSTAKQQQAASGISDAPTATAAGSAAAGAASGVAAGGNSASGTAFTSDHLHRGGFQALELMRITNITPLLWVRVDPHGLYNGRLSIFQQDACLAEQLFHDGDAAGQVEAMRALAERPLKIQGIPKITNVHDVPIAELPVRVLGDCLRGSVALHCDLPHNPAVRAQAALAIAQWQNNKAPESIFIVGPGAWLGLDLLLQYFRERFYCNGVVLPINFRRLVLHKHIVGGAGGGDTTSDGGYQYLDALAEKDERRNAIEFADEVEIEEDEEYRVRSACITAIASIRAQDGMTPKPVVEFLEDVLLSGDKAAVGSLLLPNEEEQLKKKKDQALDDEVPNSRRIIGPNDDDVSNLPYVSLSLVADALLALCHVHVRPQSDFDSSTAGRLLNPKADHPILPLMDLCLNWLNWDLERMRIRAKTNQANLTGVGDGCHTSITPCAITALCHMALLKQSTTPTPVVEKESSPTNDGDGGSVLGAKRKPESSELEKTATAQFYIDIYDDKIVRADAIRAAAAQSVVCICCAADRNEAAEKEPLGLLIALEFLLDRIMEPLASPGLRLTLALLMMDACTGKICSLQRVASFCGQKRLYGSGNRFMNGPLGSSCGGDNGSALLMTVSGVTYPAATAVNDGARRGLKLLRDSGKDNKCTSQVMVRVAKFATRLWRLINGELAPARETLPTSKPLPGKIIGICAHDNNLRCALVALWQWVWPRQCVHLLRAQSLHKMEDTHKPQWYSLGLNHVAKTNAEEKAAAALEDEALKPLSQVVEAEIDRQKWRGEMASEAYKYSKNANLTEAGQPLPTVEKDNAWKYGGWVASTAQQRRSQGADGGSAVTKIRLMVKSSSTVGENQ